MRPFAVLLVLCMTALLAGEAVAVSVPDSAQLRALDTSYRHASRLRLQLASETVELASCRAGDEGIRGITRGGDDRSLTTPRDTKRLVHWNEITKVEKGHSYVGAGILFGTIAGVALAATERNRSAHDSGLAAIAASNAAPGVVSVGAIAGGLVGAGIGLHWHSWRPAPPFTASDSRASAVSVVQGTSADPADSRH